VRKQVRILQILHQALLARFSALPACLYHYAIGWEILYQHLSRWNVRLRLFSQTPFPSWKSNRFLVFQVLQRVGRSNTWSFSYFIFFLYFFLKQMATYQLLMSTVSWLCSFEIVFQNNWAHKRCSTNSYVHTRVYLSGVFIHTYPNTQNLLQECSKWWNMLGDQIRWNCGDSLNLATIRDMQLCKALRTRARPEVVFHLRNGSGYWRRQCMIWMQTVSKWEEHIVREKANGQRHI
jgi:hypothetical protein